jgi:hypothetical protein
MERGGRENFDEKNNLKKVFFDDFLALFAKKRCYWKGVPTELLGFYGWFPVEEYSGIRDLGFVKVMSRIAGNTLSLWMGVFIPMFTQANISQAAGPGRLQPGYLPVARAIMVVCTWQITAADQELAHDFPAGEDKSFLQDMNAITTRKASYFQRKSFSNRQIEIISNTKADTWQPRLRKLGNPAHEHQEGTQCSFVSNHGHVPETARPSGLQAGDLPVDRAFGIVCARQVTARN